MSELARLEIADGTARLTLNRPEARNALSLELIEAARAALGRAAARRDVRALLLGGEGNVFCAGMDLKAALAAPGAPAKLLGAIGELTLEIRAFPTPIIAVAQGAAIGGGCGLVCVADLAWTHPEAILGFPEVDLGVCPAVVTPWLARRVGAGRARRILLEAGTLSGAQAHALGVVTHVAESAKTIEREALAMAQRIAQASPIAVRATKASLNRLEAPDRLAEHVRAGARLSAQIIESDEAQALLRARYTAS